MKQTAGSTLPSKVKALKVELALVQEKYKLGLINTPQKNNEKNKSLETFHDFVRKCAALLIQRWYRRRMGLSRKFHLWTLVTSLEKAVSRSKNKSK